MDAKFVLTFTDDTKFEGDLFKKEWRKAPEKQVKSLWFEFGGKCVKLEDYEEYNLTCENHSIPGRGQRVVNITVAGRKKEESDLIIYDLRIGRIIKKDAEKYKEHGNLISTTWKEGIKNGNPRAYHGKQNN